MHGWKDRWVDERIEGGRQGGCSGGWIGRRWEEGKKRGRQASLLPLTQVCLLTGGSREWLVALLVARFWWLGCDKVGRKMG